MRISLNRLFVSLGLVLLAACPVAAQEPIAVAQQTSPWTAAASATVSGSISLTDLDSELRGLNLAPYKIQGVDNMLVADITRDGLKVPVLFTLSQDNSRIWIKTCAVTVQPGMSPPWQKMVEMQESIKPALFSYRSTTGELLVRYSIANHGVTSDALKAAVDHFMDVFMSVRSAWDPQKWTAGGSTTAVPAPSPYRTNMPEAPESAAAVNKAIIEHAQRLADSAKEFVADSSAFENGKPVTSEAILRDLATVRRRMNTLLAELDNLPAGSDEQTRDYVKAYKNFARAYFTEIDGLLVDCAQQMTSYLDAPKPGETRATVAAAMAASAEKMVKAITPAKNDFAAAAGRFGQHFHLASN